jgi:hypothetical protein
MYQKPLHSRVPIEGSGFLAFTGFEKFRAQIDRLTGGTAPLTDESGYDIVGSAKSDETVAEFGDKE